MGAILWRRRNEPGDIRREASGRQALARKRETIDPLTLPSPPSAGRGKSWLPLLNRSPLQRILLIDHPITRSPDSRMAARLVLSPLSSFRPGRMVFFLLRFF